MKTFDKLSRAQRDKAVEDMWADIKECIKMGLLERNDGLKATDTDVRAWAILAEEGKTYE